MGPVQSVNEVSSLARQLKLPNWILPHIEAVTEVEADGHCGFRAIAVSLGWPADDWLFVRQVMIEEVKSNSRLFTSQLIDTMLGCTVDECISRLKTQADNVLDHREHWFTTQMAGIVANTFSRPVIIFSDADSRISYPFDKPLNDKPPVVLFFFPVRAHFIPIKVSLLPGFPFPTACPIWTHHHTSVARGWADRFPPPQAFIELMKMVGLSYSPVEGLSLIDVSDLST